MVDNPPSEASPARSLGPSPPAEAEGIIPIRRLTRARITGGKPHKPGCLTAGSYYSGANPGPEPIPLSQLVAWDSRS